jgi:hypothetical protein
MKKVLWFAILLIILPACAPSAAALATPLAQTLTAWPTSSPYPTNTPYPTTMPIFIVVTATYTATPLATATTTLTPTITFTPTKTHTPRPTLDPLKFDHRDGNYLVGVDIAPGVWRSEKGFDSCYWEITTIKGDIVDNYFGTSGGTIYLAPSYFAVRMEDCGTWTFLSNS